MLTQPQMYQAAAIKAAMGFYLKTGSPINRAYTRGNMLATANKLTGKEDKSLPDAIVSLQQLLGGYHG